MLKNRHVVIALLVAPLLALLAWFAVGSLWGERAAPAQPGQSYPLLSRSNCRRAGGTCDLDNHDLELRLRFHPAAEGELVLQSSHALDSVLVAIAPPGRDGSPQVMTPQAQDGRRWRLALGKTPAPSTTLRLVAGRGGARYFAESATAFMQPET